MVHADLESLILDELHFPPSFSAYYAFMSHLYIKGARKYVSLQRERLDGFFHFTLSLKIFPFTLNTFFGNDQDIWCSLRYLKN